MNKYFYLIIGLAVILAVFIYRSKYVTPTYTILEETNAQAEYNPQIDPTKFTHVIDNKYFTLPTGRELTYQGTTPDGVEKIVISISGETKEIMGVKTLLYLDKVWIDGELVEDTVDYLAQDHEGNVWYFGEEVSNYENGVLKDREGSWIAGENGALPGIWIKAQHTQGDSYRQEYFKGEAEDMQDVVSIKEAVKIEMGEYQDCVNMYAWTPLDPKSQENKYYCTEVGAMVLETKPTGERIELISIK